MQRDERLLKVGLEGRSEALLVIFVENLMTFKQQSINQIFSQVKMKHLWPVIHPLYHQRCRDV